MKTKRFHHSVTPCPDWGKSHKCYACACADAAVRSETNAIALALEDAGVPCVVEQTGGFTMVVYIYADDKKSWISLTNEGMGWCKGDCETCAADEFVEFPCDLLTDKYPEGGLKKKHLNEIVKIIKANLWRVGK